LCNGGGEIGCIRRLVVRAFEQGAHFVAAKGLPRGEEQLLCLLEVKNKRIFEECRLFGFQKPPPEMAGPDT
jgi:hypothetical protein